MDVNGNELVVDASWLLAFLLPDERDEMVVATVQKYKAHVIRLVSVPLLPLEVGNSLKFAVTRSRIDGAVAFELVHSFLCLDIPLINVKLDEVWIAAERERLTVYDAAYLTLARQRNIPLLSFDTHLKKFAVP